MKNFSEKLFHQQILNATFSYGDATALTDIITNESFTFNDIRNYSNALANFLINEYNLKKNEIIICFMPNNIFYSIIFLASALIGSPMCGVCSNATIEEFNSIIKQTNCRIIFTIFKLFNEILKEETKIPVIVIDKLINQKEYNLRNLLKNQKYFNCTFICKFLKNY